MKSYEARDHGEVAKAMECCMGRFSNLVAPITLLVFVLMQGAALAGYEPYIPVSSELCSRHISGYPIGLEDDWTFADNLF